jgi:hypothetical protein
MAGGISKRATNKLSDRGVRAFIRWVSRSRGNTRRNGPISVCLNCRWLGLSLSGGQS